MPTTVRKFWPDPFGLGDAGVRRVGLNFNWDAIDSDSVVLITASGYRNLDHVPGATLERIILMDIGMPAITVRVDNISPHGPPFDANHGVTFSVTVEDHAFSSGGQLSVVTDITVFDDKPVETQTT